jgi:hypothetical protein
VCWEGTGNDTQKGWVKSAVTGSWSSVINMNFTGWGTCGANSTGIRIRVSDERPHSAIGTDLNGRAGGMVLNFTFQYRDSNNKQPFAACIGNEQSCIRSIAVHEFGHALGFQHEQTRLDDPLSCNEEGARSGPGDTDFGDWDQSSIMNYCNPSWNNGGVLSENDKKGALFLYPTFPYVGVGNTNFGLWTKASIGEDWVGVANSAGVRDVTILPDGRLLGVGNTNFGLWTKENLTAKWVGVDNSAGVRAVDVQPGTGTIVGVGSTNFRLWTKPGDCLNCRWEAVPDNDPVLVLDIAFMPDGSLLGVGTNNVLYTRTSLQSFWTIVSNGTGVQSVSVMPNGTIIGVTTTGDLVSRPTVNSAWQFVPGSAGVMAAAYGRFNWPN